MASHPTGPGGCPLPPNGSPTVHSTFFSLSQPPGSPNLLPIQSQSCRSPPANNRLEHCRSHLANVKADADAGFWLLGGAYFSDLPKEGETPPIIGSAMLAHAESKEEVLEKLKNDIYTESDVWDWNKVQIYPFRSAIGGATAKS